MASGDSRQVRVGKFEEGLCKRVDQQELKKKKIRRKVSFRLNWIPSNFDSDPSVCLYVHSKSNYRYRDTFKVVMYRELKIVVETTPRYHDISKTVSYK